MIKLCKTTLVFMFFVFLQVMTSCRTSDSKLSEDSHSQKRILLILSSANEMKMASPDYFFLSTGIFLVEMGEAIRAFEDKGYHIDVATPDGKLPTVDVNGLDLGFYEGKYLRRIKKLTFSLPTFNQALITRRDKDIQTAQEYLGALNFSDKLDNSNQEAILFAEKVRTTQQLTEQKKIFSFSDFFYREKISNDNLGPLKLDKDKLTKYAAVYVNGGHAPMVDLNENPYLGDILFYFLKALKKLILICHGPIAFRSAGYTIDGDYDLGPSHYKKRERNPFVGYRITTVSKFEELLVLDAGYPHVSNKKSRGQATLVPYFVDEELMKAGLIVESCRFFPGCAKVIEDRNVITANGPQAVLPLVEKINKIF